MIDNVFLGIVFIAIIFAAMVYLYFAVLALCWFTVCLWMDHKEEYIPEVSKKIILWPYYLYQFIKLRW